MAAARANKPTHVAKFAAKMGKFEYHDGSFAAGDARMRRTYVLHSVWI
jgi:hypothetical protein